MSSRRDRRRAWKPPLETLPITGKTIERKRKALLRKIKSEIDGKEKASRRYTDLSIEAKLIDTEASSDIYRIAGEIFTQKVKLEQIYRKLGGIIK